MQLFFGLVTWLMTSLLVMSILAVNVFASPDPNDQVGRRSQRQRFLFVLLAILFVGWFMGMQGIGRVAALEMEVEFLQRQILELRADEPRR